MLPQLLPLLLQLGMSAITQRAALPAVSASEPAPTPNQDQSDKLMMSALMSALAKGSQPAPPVKLPWIVSATSFMWLAGLLLTLVGIFGAALSGNQAFGDLLPALYVTLGVQIAGAILILAFWYGSSYGSYSKSAWGQGGGEPPPEPDKPSPEPPSEPDKPEPSPEPVPPPFPGVGPSTDPSTKNVRSDVPYDGKTPAAIRYNNPGAAWENSRAPLFGLLGYGILKDGNHIARFPHVINGAAYNFDLLDHGYVGLTIAEARKKWTTDVSFLSGYDSNSVLTHEFVRDPAKAILFMKEVGKWEAGKTYPMTDAEWAAAHDMFLAGSADAWLKSTPEKPSQGENRIEKTLAERIVDAMRKKGYIVDTRPGEVNIVYVEGLNSDGTINHDLPNEWNDLRCVIGFEGDKPVMLGAWVATTEPGRYYTINPMNSRGAARIEFGQYQAWRVGIHRGDHEALVQRADVTVARDLNKDMVRTGDVRDAGLFGINQHGPSGAEEAGDQVEKYSAGCLVGKSMAGHRAFMAVVKTDPRFLADPDYLFRTTILAEKDVVA